MLLGAYKGEIPLNLITGLSPILYNCLHESVWIIHTHHPTSSGEQRNGHVRASDFDPRIIHYSILTPDLKVKIKNIPAQPKSCLKVFQFIHRACSSFSRNNLSSKTHPLLFPYTPLIFPHIPLCFLMFPYIFSLYSKCAGPSFYKRALIKKAFPISHIYPICCQQYGP